MTTKSQKTNEVVEEKPVKKAKGQEVRWSFPTLGVSVMAMSREEALKKAKKLSDK